MRKPFMVEFMGTPEAGKTTSIEKLQNVLSSKGYKVMRLQESAERLPEEIPKGTKYANLWMHYQTQSECLRAKFSNCDIVLADRGLVDSNFYGKKFLWEEVWTDEEYQKFRMQFMEELFPDLVIALIVSPEIAIERRGGEGRLVTKEYIEQYNEMFYKFYQEIDLPKISIETSKKEQNEVCAQLLKVIEEHLLK